MCLVSKILLAQELKQHEILKHRVKKIKEINISDSSFIERHYNQNGLPIKETIDQRFLGKGFYNDRLFFYINDKLNLVIDIYRRYQNILSRDTTHFSYDSLGRTEFMSASFNNSSDHSLTKYVYANGRSYAEKRQIWKVLHYKDFAVKYEDQIPCEFMRGRKYFLESFEVYDFSASEGNPDGIKYYKLHTSEMNTKNQLFFNETVKRVYWFGDSLKQTLNINTSIRDNILEQNVVKCDGVEFFSEVPVVLDFTIEKYKNGKKTEMIFRNFYSKHESNVGLRYYYMPNGLIKEIIKQNENLKSRIIFKYEYF